MPKEVYLIQANDLSLYKIGVSENSKKRVKKLQTGCPYELEILYVFKSKFPFKVEKMLHNKHASRKRNIDNDILKGEWFNLETNQILKFLKDCQEAEDKILFLKEAGNPFI